VGFVVDKVALGQVFLRVFLFPLPIFIPPTALQSPSSIIWGCYNRPIVAKGPSGLSLTPLIIIIIIIIIIIKQNLWPSAFPSAVFHFMNLQFLFTYT
jgi:hypothetical protein